MSRSISIHLVAALRSPRFWPVFGLSSLFMATISTSIALYEVVHLERRFDRGAELQMRLLSDRMNDAIAEAQEQARAGDERLAKRIDELVLKFDPNSSPLGTAVQKMQSDLSTVLSIAKKPTPAPASTPQEQVAPGPKLRKPS